MEMHVVIVGSGVAGVTAARILRVNNPKAKISIYTDENHLFYPRPRLYEVLSGEASPQEIYMFSEQWYEERGIKVHLNKKVTDVETTQKQLTLEDHSRVNYDKVLLANGAHPFIPPIKGVEKTGVFALRSVQDALTIREYAKKTRNCFFFEPWSAIAPSIGAIRATIKLAMEFAWARRAVLVFGSTPRFQYCLKNTGKKPAMIVVTNAEFAQSYMAQPQMAFCSFFILFHPTRTRLPTFQRAGYLAPWPRPLTR